MGSICLAAGMTLAHGGDLFCGDLDQGLLELARALETQAGGGLRPFSVFVVAAEVSDSARSRRLVELVTRRRRALPAPRPEFDDRVPSVVVPRAVELGGASSPTRSVRRSAPLPAGSRISSRIRFSERSHRLLPATVKGGLGARCLLLNLLGLSEARGERHRS